jgi:glycosyltransferase involved in cell wall biosynthesis
MWTEDKKAHILLDILDSIDRDTRLIIVGRWDLASYEKFTREVKNRKLDSRVSLTGEINEEKLTDLYRRARVMVHVMTEAFGMTGLEAASHGCPFIIPEGSGVTEIFNHDVHGFFPKEGEFDRYVEYVNKLISDEHLAWKMGYKAWKVSKEYTWGKHTKKLVEATEAAITARN